jgi:SAM-dependent methyltransferase
VSLEVLTSRDQVDDARSRLDARGISSLTRPWFHWARRFGLGRSIKLGDRLKSWDILRTAEFIENNVRKDGPVLDIGAFASEILPVLRKLGYTDLTGVDMNPDIGLMPFAGEVRYEVSDFMHTPFEPASFAVVTAISVIEHGLDSARLLAELTRLLEPGGFFIASFDYWPEKIDTSDTRLFGMDWRIFSRADVESFVADARKAGLEPVGALNFDASAPAIHWSGRHYTFAWIALRKVA